MRRNMQLRDSAPMRHHIGSRYGRITAAMQSAFAALVRFYTAKLEEPARHHFGCYSLARQKSKSKVGSTANSNSFLGDHLHQFNGGSLRCCLRPRRRFSFVGSLVGGGREPPRIAPTTLGDRV